MKDSAWHTSFGLENMKKYLSLPGENHHNIVYQFLKLAEAFDHSTAHGYVLRRREGGVDG